MGLQLYLYKPKSCHVLKHTKTYPAVIQVNNTGASKRKIQENLTYLPD